MCLPDTAPHRHYATEAHRCAYVAHHAAFVVPHRHISICMKK